jgi:hypothetical protein
VANAVEAVGQDVHQKAADEFVYWQRHGPDHEGRERLSTSSTLFWTAR